MRRARLLAIALLCLLSPTLGIMDVAAVDSPTLSVRLGYQSAVRATEWMPVDVQGDAGGAPVDGVLQVQIQDSSKGYLERQNFTSQPNPFGPTYATVYALPVKAAAGSSAHIRTYLLTDVQNPTVSVRLVRSGRTVSGPVTAVGQTTALLVGVLSARPAAFDGFAALHLPSNLTPRVVPLTVSDLPDSAVLLRAFDLLAIDDFPTSTLTTGQQAALADYVNAGGSLLLGTGDSSLTWRGLPASLLPIEIQGTRTLSRAASLPGVTGLPVATGTLRGGNVWLAEGTQPLVVEWSVGSGIVTLATLSFTAPPMANWNGTSALLRQIAVRSVLRGAQSSAAPASLAPGHGPITGPLGFQGSVTKRSWFLMPDLGSAPTVSLPPLPLLGLLIVAYALLVGPLSFLLLRRFDRLAWLWFIAPVIALLPVAVIWIASARGHTVAVNQFSVTYLAQGWPKGYRETFTAIRPSQTGDYRVGLSAPQMIAPFAVGYGPDDNIGVGIRVDTRTPAVDLLQVTRASVRGYATEGTVAVSGPSAQLNLANGQLKGQVKNGSTTHFIDAVLLVGGSIIHVGDLPPGGTVPIDASLTTATATSGGGLISLQLYPNSFSGSGSTAGPLTGDHRISLLQLILGEYDTPSSQLAPTLLAWAPGVAEPIAIDGGSPRLDTQNAIVVPLAINQVSAGPLPMGFFAPRLVDATGQVGLSQYGAAVDNGSVTYEFSLPLAAGTHVSGLKITHLLAAGPFPPSGLVGPNGQPAAKSEVWDWSRSTWVPVSLANGGTSPLPDGTLQSGTGLVRLRLESAGGASFRVGSLWLEGTVSPGN
ncbi:MAG TPA: hypothetical protein VGR77_07110 [Candidatus Dormibacteraeota bacterium]|nr:hypothetical protein [Candidatus Dormibacteraeota bacterium]